MAHLCVPQNQALGVCRGFVPDIQICGTQWEKEDLVNATIISNAGEEEEVGKGLTSARFGVCKVTTRIYMLILVSVSLTSI